MASKGLNQCNFIGNLGADPQIKFMENGNPIANLTIAVGDSYKDKDGNKIDKTEWVRLVAFGKLAEIIGQYLTKGAAIQVTSKVQTRSWEDNDGIKHWMTEFVVQDMIMLGGGKRNDAVEDSDDPEERVSSAKPPREEVKPVKKTFARPERKSLVPDDLEDEDLPF